MKWKNRCPYRIFSWFAEYQQWRWIDRCYCEAEEAHEHWSKNHSFHADWRLEAPTEAGDIDEN